MLRLKSRLRVALGFLAAVLVFGGGFLWFRDSAFVAVRDITVTGVSSSEGAAVRDALRDAASEMTTLHVRQDDLRNAVERFASVASVQAEPDFPHALTIEVTERKPVAAVEIAGSVVPVGAGGRLMRGVRAGDDLPAVKANRLAPGDRLSDAKALAAVTVLADAPVALRSKVARADYGPKGLTLLLRAGPVLFFGDDERVHAKWAAVARVLADPSAEGAVYLDARVPDRVAAGGLGTVSEEEPDILATQAQAQPLNTQPQPENTASLNP